MSTSIHELLDDLRARALDERDKGDKFEQLIRAYLTTDPEWTARFSDVWLWSEWPERGGRPDTGIDLVAANADDDGLTAIQCKFYAPARTVAKADIDSFVSASASSQFTQRIVFDTAAGWSANAEETLAGGVAQRVDIGYLTDAAIDWSRFSWATPQIVVPTGKKALRPHQQKALDDVRAGLATHDRPAGDGLRHRQDLHQPADRRGPGRRWRQRAVPGAEHPAAVPEPAGVDGQRQGRHSGPGGLLRRPADSSHGELIAATVISLLEFLLVASNVLSHSLWRQLLSVVALILLVNLVRAVRLLGQQRRVDRGGPPAT